MTALGLVAFIYHLGSRLAYVLGVGGILLRPDRRADEDFPAARRLFAILMNNDAVSLVVLCIATYQTLPGPRLAFLVAGAALTVTGLVVKLWARAAVGADNYYWRDFFGAPPPPLPGGLGGPYRYLNSPMYTVGNLPLWGLALIAASWPALVAAAFDHVAILTFNRIVEQPHVHRVYGAARPDREPSAGAGVGR